jgi:medium-chain acyl-[acyl-carrier-protein] hydrolase
MALETARHIQRMDLPPPVCLIVSGRFPPHAENVRNHFHAMPNVALLDEMRRLGGTPDEVMAHREILDMLLPVVRDDFRLLETHDALAEPLVRIPVHVCCGMDDEDSPMSLLRRWSEVTAQSCSITLFAGGHFYISESRDELLRHIARIIRAETDILAKERGE